MKNKSLIVIILFFTFSCSKAVASYEVVSREVNSYFIEHGKSIKSKGMYESHFLVDENNGIVTRTKVINLRTNEPLIDNSQYKIIHNRVEYFGLEYLGIRNPSGFIGFILRVLDKNPKSIEKKIIKAFGQVGMIDGYELLIIGDDFVSQNKSAFDYFIVVYSKRCTQK